MLSRYITLSAFLHLGIFLLLFIPTLFLPPSQPLPPVVLTFDLPPPIENEEEEASPTPKPSANPTEFRQIVGEAIPTPTSTRSATHTRKPTPSPTRTATKKKPTATKVPPSITATKKPTKISTKTAKPTETKKPEATKTPKPDLAATAKAKQDQEVAKVAGPANISPNPPTHPVDGAPSGMQVSNVNFKDARYLSRLQQALQREFQPPRLLRGSGKRTAKVYFKILRNGDIKDIQVAGSSGHKKVDRAARAAVEAIRPFTEGSLPNGIKDLGVTCEFVVE